MLPLPRGESGERLDASPPAAADGTGNRGFAWASKRAGGRAVMMNADFSEARRKERHEENQYDEIAHGLADPERGFAFASVTNLMKMGMRGDQRL